MQKHLLTVQEIIQALVIEDYAAVKESAKNIATSKSSEKMCSKMGRSAPDFVTLGKAFHAKAETIIEAADRKDYTATLQALGNTLQYCNSCHSQYRQEIVSTLK